MSFIAEYPKAAEIILSRGGVVSIHGSRGIGKTELCRKIIADAAAKGLTAAYIDAELARGICSPPGTVSLSYITDRTDKYTAAASFFVGDIVPTGHMAAYLSAVMQAIAEAKAAGTQLIVIDSCGKTDYSTLFPAKQNEIEILRPDYIIALQRDREAEFIIRPFINRPDILCTVRNVSAHQYSPLIAKTNFRSEMHQYMKGSKDYIISFSQAAFLNTWLACGRELKWQYRKSISQILNFPVVHGELAGRTLILFTDAIISEENNQAIRSMLKIDRIQTISPNAFKNLFAGLADADCRLLSVGTIKNIDYENKQLTVASPILTISPIRNIYFGFFCYSYSM